MYILEVIPIESGIPVDTLTYYNKEILEVGTMVEIDIGNRKNLRALVISVDDVRNQKSILRASDWATKKINKVINISTSDSTQNKAIIDKDLLLAIYKTSLEYMMSPSTLLSILISKERWNGKDNSTQKEIHIVPTRQEFKALSKINKDTNIVYSMPNLDLIINHYPEMKVVFENSESPYYQHAHWKRNMMEVISSVLGVVPSPQGDGGVYVLNKIKIITDEFEYKTPLISAVTDRLIQNVIQNHKDGGQGKLLIYANRKGESPLSRCYDCGLDMLCETCEMPLVLHKKLDKKWYSCHHCNFKKEIIQNNTEEETDTSNQIECKHCGGWRIMPIGISTGSISNNLKEIYPFLNKEKNENSIPLFILDSENASTPLKVNRILASWKSEGGILVTNDIGLNDRSRPNLQSDYSIIISLDGMYSIPDTGIEKRILYTLNRLNEMTKNQVILHTHLYQHPLVNTLQETDTKTKTQKINNLLKEINHKLEIAKLPPYYHNIKVTFKKESTFSEALSNLELYIKDNDKYEYKISFPYIHIKVKRGLDIKDPTYLYLYQALNKGKVEYGVMF